MVGTGRCSWSKNGSAPGLHTVGMEGAVVAGVAELMDLSGSHWSIPGLVSQGRAIEKIESWMCRVVSIGP